eukprot:1052577-Amphidinium_carterae.1
MPGNASHPLLPMPNCGTPHPSAKPKPKMDNTSFSCQRKMNNTNNNNDITPKNDINRNRASKKLSKLLNKFDLKP